MTAILIDKTATAQRLFGEANKQTVRRVERLFDKYKENGTGLRYKMVGHTRYTTEAWLLTYLEAGEVLVAVEQQPEPPKRKVFNKRRTNLPWE